MTLPRNGQKGKTSKPTKIIFLFVLGTLFSVPFISKALAGQVGYELRCKAKLLAFDDLGMRLVNIPKPLSFRIISENTVGISWINPKDKSETKYDDLLLEFDHKIIKGGTITGSIVDFSTTFDGDFSKTGYGNVVWSFSRFLKAWTVTFHKSVYLCKMKSLEAL